MKQNGYSGGGKLGYADSRNAETTPKRVSPKLRNGDDNSINARHLNTLRKREHVVVQVEAERYLAR